MKRIVVLAVFIALALSACALNQTPDAPGQEQAGLEPQALAGNRVMSNYGHVEFGEAPAGLTYIKAMTFDETTYVLRSDGRILRYAPEGTYCSPDFPPLPPGLRYIDLARYLALRSDGTLLGKSSCTITPLYNVPKDSSFIAVAGNTVNGMALRSNGTIVAWGDNTYGQLNVPPLPVGLRYTAIDSFGVRFALRNDGQIITWGDYMENLSNVPPLPAGVKYTSFSVQDVGVALRSDGRAVAWGDHNLGEQNNPPPLPTGMTYTAVTACSYCTALLRSDGQVITTGHLDAYGDPAFSQLPLGSRYLALAGGNYKNVALVAAPPLPKHLYAITFDGLLDGVKPRKVPYIVSSVALGRGVIYGSRTPVGQGNPNPVQVFGSVKGSSENRAVVLGTTANKSLALLAESGTSVSGGTLGLSFVPSFNSNGVTIKSLKVTGGSNFIPSKLTVKLYAVDGTSRTVGVPLRSSSTVNLGDTGVKAISISLGTPFTLDDIAFGE